MTNSTKKYTESDLIEFLSKRTYQTPDGERLGMTPDDSLTLTDIYRQVFDSPEAVLTDAYDFWLTLS